MIGGVAQREQGTKGGTFYRARKHQSEWLFPPGSLGNTKQSFLTSETQDVIEHFILEAPVSPDSLGRVTRVWRDQLSSSACLAVSLRVCFSRGARILPEETNARSPWWVWCVGDGSVEKYSHAGCPHTQLSALDDATGKYLHCNTLALQASLHGGGCGTAASSVSHLWKNRAHASSPFRLQPFAPHSSVTRILPRHFVSHWLFSML